MERSEEHYDESSSETSKLIIRFYGGNKSAPWEKSELLDHGFGRELENTVALAASATGIGPKVFYSSDTCRIEQFVQSRNFTFNDYCDLELVQQFARNLARFHSMIDRPEFDRFRVKKVNLFDHTRTNLTCNFDRWTRICKVASEKYGFTGKPSDIVDELNLMEKLSHQVPLKYTLINWDLNTMNILVRDKVTHQNQLQTVLIDYEFAHFNFRSFDIGLNASRMALRNLAFGDKFDYPAGEITLQLKAFEEHFLTAYHDEYSKCSPNLDPSGLDKWTSFVTEALWGSCFAWIESTALRLVFLFALMPDEEQVIDINARGLRGLFGFHCIAKERLFQLAPHLRDTCNG